jgi:hypothetical protein
MFSMPADQLFGNNLGEYFMAYMAQLDDNNVVIRVLSVSNNDCPDPAPQHEAQGAAFLESLGLGINWKQCSFNATFRKQYPGIGYTYDADADVFVAPQSFPSWTLDDNHDWQPPTPMPSEGGPFYWDEDSLSWIAVDE